MAKNKSMYSIFPNPGSLQRYVEFTTIAENFGITVNDDIQEKDKLLLISNQRALGYYSIANSWKEFTLSDSKKHSFLQTKFQNGEQIINRADNKGEDGDSICDWQMQILMNKKRIYQ